MLPSGSQYGVILIGSPSHAIPHMAVLAAGDIVILPVEVVKFSGAKGPIPGAPPCSPVG
jgi:hypothetical protein